MPSAEHIERALAGAGVERPCPRCGGKGFDVEEDFVNVPLSPTPTVGAHQPLELIPSVATVCNGCGFIALHSARLLGLL